MNVIPRPLTQTLLDRREKYLPEYAYKLDTSGSRFGMDTPFVTDVADIDESRMAVWINFASGLRRDGVGDLLEVGGIDCSRHKMNPIVLYDHGKTVSLPVGLTEDPDSKDYMVQLDTMNRTARAKAFFYQGKGDLIAGSPQPDYDHALFCEQLFDLIAKRYVRAGSIGYQVMKAMPLPPDYMTGTPQGLHLLQTLLLEVSAVVMPANADTVRKALCMKTIAGKPPSPVLVKSLSSYAQPKKSQMGYEPKMFGSQPYQVVLRPADKTERMVRDHDAVQGNDDAEDAHSLDVLGSDGYVDHNVMPIWNRSREETFETHQARASDRAQYVDATQPRRTGHNPVKKSVQGQKAQYRLKPHGTSSPRIAVGRVHDLDTDMVVGEGGTIVMVEDGAREISGRVSKTALDSMAQQLQDEGHEVEVDRSNNKKIPPAPWKPGVGAISEKARRTARLTDEGITMTNEQQAALNDPENTGVHQHLSSHAGRYLQGYEAVSTTLGSRLQTATPYDNENDVGKDRSHTLIDQRTVKPQKTERDRELIEGDTKAANKVGMDYGKRTYEQQRTAGASNEEAFRSSVGAAELNAAIDHIENDVEAQNASALATGRAMAQQLRAKRLFVRKKYAQKAPDKRTVDTFLTNYDLPAEQRQSAADESMQLGISSEDFDDSLTRVAELDTQRYSGTGAYSPESLAAHQESIRRENESARRIINESQPWKSEESGQKTASLSHELNSVKKIQSGFKSGEDWDVPTNVSDFEVNPQHVPYYSSPEEVQHQTELWERSEDELWGDFDEDELNQMLMAQDSRRSQHPPTPYPDTSKALGTKANRQQQQDDMGWLLRALEETDSLEEPSAEVTELSDYDFYLPLGDAEQKAVRKTDVDSFMANWTQWGEPEGSSAESELDTRLAGTQDQDLLDSWQAADRLLVHRQNATGPYSQENVRAHREEAERLNRSVGEFVPHQGKAVEQGWNPQEGDHAAVVYPNERIRRGNVTNREGEDTPYVFVDTDAPDNYGEDDIWLGDAVDRDAPREQAYVRRTQNAKSIKSVRAKYRRGYKSPTQHVSQAGRAVIDAVNNDALRYQEQTVRNPELGDGSDWVWGDQYMTRDRSEEPRNLATDYDDDGNPIAWE